MHNSARSGDAQIRNIPSDSCIMNRVFRWPHGRPEAVHTRRTAGLLHRCEEKRSAADMRSSEEYCRKKSCRAESPHVTKRR